jgi:hypothetical protein
MALAIHLVGFECFFIDLFAAMKVPLTDGVRHYLMMQHRRRSVRREKSKTRQVKCCDESTTDGWSEILPHDATLTQKCQKGEVEDKTRKRRINNYKKLREAT